VIPPIAGFAAWTTDGEDAKPTHELVGRLEKVAMVATAKGADCMRAKLLTWHRRLGHPSFKTVVALAKSGADGMVITDLPTKVLGLDACAAYLGRVHTDMVGPMPIKSAGGKSTNTSSTVAPSTHVHRGSSRRQQKPSRYSRPQQKTSRKGKCASHD
jgi:hypothetical protein